MMAGLGYGLKSSERGASSRRKDFSQLQMAALRIEATSFQEMVLKCEK
jgi:hypothetical protein